MKDTLAISAPAAVQPRAVGLARLGVMADAGRTRLATFRQQGSAKVLYPRTATPDLHAVLLNTAGGITGGDRFRYDANAGPGAALTLTTQAAERAYRAQPGLVGHLDVALSAEAGSVLHWLPQETIVFEGAALARTLTVNLAADARFLAVEPVILGRTAMGEVVHDATLTDQWRIHRDETLVYADALRLAGDMAAIADRPAVLDGGRAFASMIFVSPEADLMLEPLRDTLPPRAGASLVRPGVLVARIVAADGFHLRRALIPCLELLRQAPLPTVWKM